MCTMVGPQRTVLVVIGLAETSAEKKRSAEEQKPSVIQKGIDGNDDMTMTLYLHRISGVTSIMKC